MRMSRILRSGTRERFQRAVREFLYLWRECEELTTPHITLSPSRILGTFSLSHVFLVNGPGMPVFRGASMKGESGMISTQRGVVSFHSSRLRIYPIRRSMRTIVFLVC